MAVVGRVVGGDISQIAIRKDPNVSAEIGEIVYYENAGNIYIYQIYSVSHSSYLSSKEVESLAYKLDAYTNVDVADKDHNYYVLLHAKPLVSITSKGEFSNIKSIPPLFTHLYKIDEHIGRRVCDLIGEGMDIGYIRSGSHHLNISIPFNLIDAINHHILICATTGRGKSNLLKVMVWKTLSHPDLGLLVLDPHDEYVTPDTTSLVQHAEAHRYLYYYSTRTKEHAPNNALIRIDVSLLKPHHFYGVFNFSEAQIQAMLLAYSKSKTSWVRDILVEDAEMYGFLDDAGVREETLSVLRRKFMSYLNVSLENERLLYNSVFRDGEGNGFVEDVVSKLERGCKVVLDTSELSMGEELLISSLLSSYIFERYKNYKKKGVLSSKAKIGIVLEEAPRMLNSSVLVSDSNIFGSIAREGRKFNIGFVAVTQLPSLIPSEILANMNTKIILGMEMERERNVVIESSPHDLSKDSRIIATLNKGEGIISSIFTPFPIPVYVYDFEELVEKESKNEVKEKISGLNRSLSFE